MVLRKIVGDVVPDHGSLLQLHAFFKSFERLVFLPRIQERLAEAYFQFGIFGSENGGLVKLRHSFRIFVLFEEERAERGVSDGVEGIDVELLAERDGGFIVFLLLLQGEAQVIVNVLIVGIHFHLFAKCRGGIAEFAEPQIGKA